MAKAQDPAQAQDQLRPVRQFISLLAGATGDQTYAGYDSYAVNPSGQFYAQGPNGVAVEGQPIVRTPGGGVSLSPAIVMLGIGAVLAYVWLK